MEELKQKLLEPYQQLMFFLYILEEGLPEWCHNDAIGAFARFMNITQDEAYKIANDAVERGFITKD